MKTPRILLLAGVLCITAAILSAQPGPIPALPPESRQFDFWIGDWNVTTPDGKPAGTNKIVLIAGGAGLLENWTDADGSSGKSLNAYNAAKKQWQQFWIGSNGGILELAGALVNGRMVLTGAHDSRGRHIMERITWTPNPDGTVRQHWEQSIDGAKTWQTVFDGLYRRNRLAP